MRIQRGAPRVAAAAVAAFLCTALAWAADPGTDVAWHGRTISAAVRAEDATGPANIVVTACGHHATACLASDALHDVAPGTRIERVALGVDHGGALTLDWTETPVGAAPRDRHAVSIDAASWIVRPAGLARPAADVTPPDLTLAAHLDRRAYDPVRHTWSFDVSLTYANVGGTDAVTTNIVGVTALPVTVGSASSWPVIPFERGVSTITYRVGTLAKDDPDTTVIDGSHGAAFLTLEVLDTTPPGSPVTLTLTISTETEETNTADNTATITTAVPMLAPLLLDPLGPLATCRSSLALTGFAQPGVSVALAGPGGASATAATGLDGAFSVTVPGLAAPGGTYTLTSSYLGTPGPALELPITVDPAAGADLAGSTLWDAAGRAQPLARAGLFPGYAYELRVASCCPTAPAAQHWTAQFDGTAHDLDWDATLGAFTGSITAPAASGASEFPLTLEYTCDESLAPRRALAAGPIGVRVVPGTIVFDAAEGAATPLSHADVTVSVGRPASDADGWVWQAWPADAAAGRINPQTTALDGYYGFPALDLMAQLEAVRESDTRQPYTTPPAFSSQAPLASAIPLAPQTAPYAYLTLLATGPSKVTYALLKGRSLGWVNEDVVPLRLATDDDPADGTGGFDSGIIRPGGRFTWAFPEIGTWQYHANVGDWTATVSATATAVTPEEGAQGTRLTIDGTGFGKVRGKVKVGGGRCNVQSWTDTKITCRLWVALGIGVYDVTVSPHKAVPIVFPENFTMRAPSITSLDPIEGAVRTTITISGKFFGSRKGKVSLGGKNCRITNWIMDIGDGTSSANIVVPQGLTAGTYDLTISNKTGSITMADAFTVK